MEMPSEQKAKKKASSSVSKSSKNGNNTKAVLEEKTGKLFEAARVISQALDTLEADTQLPKVLSLSRNASTLSLNPSSQKESVPESQIPSGESISQRATDPHLTRSVAELDCKEPDYPYKSNPDSIFVPADKDFFSKESVPNDQRGKPDPRPLKGAMAASASQSLDMTRETEIRVRDALASESSPINTHSTIIKTAGDDDSPQTMMKMLLLHYEKENLELKNQILSKSNLELSSNAFRSQEYIAPLPTTVSGTIDEELTRLRGIEVKYQSLVQNPQQPSASFQSQINNLKKENADLKHKLSGQTMEIKSLVDQVEILRIENKKLIESEILARTPQGKGNGQNYSMDLAAQQALLTAIDEANQGLDTKSHPTARSLLDRTCKSLKLAVERTHDETMFPALRQCLYTTKEIIQEWMSDSIGVDERLAKMSTEANTIRQEAQDLVIRMDKKVNELKDENSELQRKIASLQKSSEEAPSRQAGPPLERLTDQDAINNQEQENAKLRLQIEELIKSVKDHKQENEILARQLKLTTLAPEERYFELESLVDKYRDALDEERLGLRKAQELIYSLQEEHGEKSAEIAVLKARLSQLQDGNLHHQSVSHGKFKSLGQLDVQKESVSSVSDEIDRIFGLVQGTQTTLDRLTDLKTDLKGLQKSKKTLEKENAELKSRLETLRASVQKRELDWQSQFKEIQSTSQSIHEHHKELELILIEYDGQYEAVKALYSTFPSDLIPRDSLIGRSKLEDPIHPYPFLDHFVVLQRSLQSVQQSLSASVQCQHESQKKLTLLEQQLTSQSLLLDATSADKATLAKQYEITLRNRDLTLSQLETCQKDLCVFRDRSEALEKKMKKILQVYANQVVPSLTSP